MKYSTYILKKINDRIFGYLSISLDYTRLDEYLCDIESDLKRKNFKGKIIFDLLTNNGLKDRFYQADFDGNKILLESISNISSLDLGIKKVSSNYYLSNFNLIQQSYISNQSKFLIRKELEKTVSA
ncbi:MAG: type II toxin-antitoxin system RnlB family antitoxin [Ferruginibacter sp.]